MSRFTDQKQRVATLDEVRAPWSGEKNRQRTRFRCHLCGHVFREGDKWRWIYATKEECPSHFNFMVCEPCDGPDVKQRMEAHAKHIRKVAWWAFDPAPLVDKE